MKPWNPIIIEGSVHINLKMFRFQLFSFSAGAPSLSLLFLFHVAVFLLGERLLLGLE